MAVDHLGNSLGRDSPEMQSSVQVKKKSVIAVLNSIEDFKVFSDINKQLDSQKEETEIKSLTINPLDVSSTEVKQLKTAVPLVNEADHERQVFVVDVGRTYWNIEQFKKYHGIE